MPSAGAAAACRVLEVSGQGEELLFMLFPHLRGLRVGQVEDTGDAVVIRACCRAAQAQCPACGAVSSRVHGGYARVVADGAAGGRPVLIALSVRRFRCPEPSCPKATFAEQAGGLSERYRRRSVPLLGMLAGFGLELAGRAAARRRGRAGPFLHRAAAGHGAVRPSGHRRAGGHRVDDFALRKGHVYGTVVADAESGDVIDLLPDREAATLREWLKARPGAEVICRDRAGAYAEGARDGAPGAIQVADRWHLWHNLAEYAEKTVTRHRGCLKEQPAADAAGDEDTPAVPDGSLDVCGRERQMARRTRERYAEIRQRLDAGQPEAAIRRTTGLDRRTVQKYARAASADELVAGMSRESRLDEFKPYICQRWNQGLTDASQIHAELRQRGWAGSPQTVRRYVRVISRVFGTAGAGRDHQVGAGHRTGSRGGFSPPHRQGTSRLKAN